MLYMDIWQQYNGVGCKRYFTLTRIFKSAGTIRKVYTIYIPSFFLPERTYFQLLMVIQLGNKQGMTEE